MANTLKHVEYLMFVLSVALLAAILTITSGCGSNEFARYYVNGPAGADGAAGSDGAKGETGDQGAQGIPGATGAAGSNGSNGSNGTNATPITIVQLCGSCVAAYPATFPEIGMCINNKLFGVYSANGGFMVEIRPGSYSSNGINCSCTFTVAANCQVN